VGNSRIAVVLMKAKVKRYRNMIFSTSSHWNSTPMVVSHWQGMTSY